LVINAFGYRFVKFDYERLLIAMLVNVYSIFGCSAGRQHILTDIVIWIGLYNNKQYHQYNNRLVC